MRLRCLLFALLACAGVCQQPRLPSALTGTVEKMADGFLYLKTGRQSFAVRTDDRTVVWKDRREQSVSAVAAGEKIRVRVGTRPLGDDVATRVSAATITFSGMAGRDFAGGCGFEEGRRFRVGSREVCVTPKTAVGPVAPAGAKDGARGRVGLRGRHGGRHTDRGLQHRPACELPEALGRYQKTTFSAAKAAATTPAQKMGRCQSGRWPSEGRGVQP